MQKPKTPFRKVSPFGKFFSAEIRAFPSASDSLYPQKHLLQIHKVQKAPFHQQYHQGQYNFSIRFAEQLHQPLEQSLSSKVPINEIIRQVNQDGVHPNYGKKESPTPIAQHINNVVKQG